MRRGVQAPPQRARAGACWQRGTRLTRPAPANAGSAAMATLTTATARCCGTRRPTSPTSSACRRSPSSAPRAAGCTTGGAGGSSTPSPRGGPASTATATPRSSRRSPAGARLDHVMFAGFTHAPAVELAEALLAQAPPGRQGVLRRLRLGGRRGRAQAQLISAAARPASPRGASRPCKTATTARPWGAGAVRQRPLPRHLRAAAVRRARAAGAGVRGPSPEPADGDLGADTPEADAAVALLERHAGELTAVVIEPLVQCAGRMAMTGTGYYRRIVAAARRGGST
jgi:hypothetical protein